MIYFVLEHFAYGAHLSNAINHQHSLSLHNLIKTQLIILKLNCPITQENTSSWNRKNKHLYLLIHVFKFVIEDKSLVSCNAYDDYHHNTCLSFIPLKF